MVMSDCEIDGCDLTAARCSDALFEMTSSIRYRFTPSAVTLHCVRWALVLIIGRPTVAVRAGAAWYWVHP